MGPALTEGPHRRRRVLVAVWLAAALCFGSLVALARSAESGRDDPDPARQRPGFLDAGGLPQPAPSLAGGLPRRERPTVVFFLRPEDVPRLCRSLAGAALGMRVQLVVVVSGTGRCNGVATVNDGPAGLADAYGLPHPRSGGNPVGYAVVDRDGLVRYRTLDPEVADNLAEVATILRALP